MKDLLEYLHKNATAGDITVIGMNAFALMQAATIAINFIAAVVGIGWLIYRIATRKKGSSD